MNCLFGQRDGGWKNLTVPDECSSSLLRNDRSALLIQCFLNPNISQDISIYFQTQVTVSLPVKNPESPSFIIFSAMVADCHRSPNQFLTLVFIFFLILRVMFWFNCSSLTSKHVSWLFHVYGEQDMLFPFACLLDILFSKGTSQEILYK